MPSATTKEPYVLIAALGLTPPVLTETVWAYWHNTGRVPERVEVVTTSMGWSLLQDQIYGDYDLKRGRDGPILRSWSDLWEQFCTTVLGLEEALVIEPRIAQRDDGVEIDDLRDGADDRRFAEMCHDVVRRLTLTDGLPDVLGSIAGGRKTISAHLLNAFSLSARPQDELVHVLVKPTGFERPGYFWPNPEADPEDLDRVDPAGMELDLVDVPFPRLRRVFAEHFEERLKGDWGLDNMLNVLKEYAGTSPPSVLEVTLGRGARKPNHRLALLGRDGISLTQKPFTLPSRELGFFLILADAMAERRADGQPFGCVRTEMGREEAARAERQRKAFRALVEAKAPAKGKQDQGTLRNKENAKKIWSELRRNIDDFEVARMFYDRILFEKAKGHELATLGAKMSGRHLEYDYFRWPLFNGQPLDLDIRVRLNTKAYERVDLSSFDWPFSTIARPE